MQIQTNRIQEKVNAIRPVGAGKAARAEKALLYSASHTPLPLPTHDEDLIDYSDDDNEVSKAAPVVNDTTAPVAAQEARPITLERDFAPEASPNSKLEHTSVSETGCDSNHEHNPTQEEGHESNQQDLVSRPGTDDEMDIDGQLPSVSIAKAKSSVHYAWQDETLSLEERVSEWEAFNKDAKVRKNAWLANGKPMCACGKCHPPPCHTDFIAWSNARQVGDQLFRELAKQKKALHNNADKQMQDVPAKKTYTWCKVCAKRHEGGAAVCRAPVCPRRGCGLNHGPREACPNARRRFVEAGLLDEASQVPEPSRASSQAKRKADDDGDDELKKYSSMFDAMPADAVDRLGSLMAFRKKQKVEPDGSDQKSDSGRDAQPRGRGRARGRGRGRGRGTLPGGD
jgi:hypothetical protein